MRCAGDNRMHALLPRCGVIIIARSVALIGRFDRTESGDAGKSFVGFARRTMQDGSTNSE
jgi:hypothetical protein